MRSEIYEFAKKRLCPLSNGLVREYPPSTVNVACETHTSVHLINFTVSHKSVGESRSETKSYCCRISLAHEICFSGGPREAPMIPRKAPKRVSMAIWSVFN